MERLEKFKYTLKHKKAFLVVEKQITGRNTLKGYLHDIDKLMMYPIIGVEKTSNIHRKYSKHHRRSAKTQNDFIQMIIDWECARLTKPDKPLNAFDTLNKYYPELKPKILPLLKQMNLIE